MIDITVLRTDPERLERSLARRGIELDVAELVRLDEEVRRVRHESETLRAEQREAGKRIAQLSGDEKAEAIAQMSRVSERFKELSVRADEAQTAFEARWVTIPNLVDPSAADGFTDADNV
ncbi:MAG: hypothetical protein WEA76_02945, partial [Acidimicrobiia bacterium]